MIVLILTNNEHFNFVVDAVKPHDCWISAATMFPNEYDVGISFMHLNKVPKEEIDTHPWINFHPAHLLY